MAGRQADQLSLTFSALADPARRRILEALRLRNHSVSEVAELLDLTLAGALKHLRLLEKAGLAVSRKVGRARHYRLREMSMSDAIAWMERGQRMWSESLGALRSHLEKGEQ
jgi:DNA-binding transcriptional ArsR family regulator